MYLKNFHFPVWANKKGCKSSFICSRSRAKLVRFGRKMRQKVVSRKSVKSSDFSPFFHTNSYSQDIDKEVLFANCSTVRIQSNRVKFKTRVVDDKNSSATKFTQLLKALNI